jgi:glycosyltransferase involved in cell wall biosynthesis
LHILFIPSWYSTLENPIRGNFFRGQAHALAKAGHRVGMLVPPTKLRSRNGIKEFQQHWHKPNTQVTSYIDSGIPVYRILWWGWRPSFFPWLRGDLALEVYDRYCEEHGKPDVLHAHSVLYGGYLAACIGQKRHVPIVLTEHSSNYRNRLILPGQDYITRYTLRHTQKIFAVGVELANSLHPYAAEKEIDVLWNMVDTDCFTLLPIDMPSSPFVFIMVASLIRLKGHHILLPAFAQAFKNENVLLKIVGFGYSGRKLQRLQHSIRSLGIENQVEIIGLVSTPAEMAVLLQHSHALVSSSQIETFGVTVIEAMASGKPVVATRSGGPEYFVSENSGILVPVNDPPALAAAMQQLVQNYSRYDPVTIRAECVAQFSEQAIVKRLEQVYQSVITP